jgi:hypothetical protein
MHRRVAVSAANPTIRRQILADLQRKTATAALLRPFALGMQRVGWTRAMHRRVAVSAANPTIRRRARADLPRKTVTAASSRPFAFGHVAADASVVGFAALTATLR